MLETLFQITSHILFTFALAYYLMTNLQWYHYKFGRVILHHNKTLWHLLYFLVPLFLYILFSLKGILNYFWIVFYLGYLPALYLWQKKLDKPLVLTSRVKRFFGFLLFALLVSDSLCAMSSKCAHFGSILPLVVAWFASLAYEKILFSGFYKRAQKRLQSDHKLKIIAVTASYGKTSIKNFLYQILSQQFHCYKTPRSVNTLAGLVKDVNENLKEGVEIYIAEAGARERGDIDEIARFLEEHYAVVGSIGPAHIEYFKTLENIRNTKMEILHSKRLKKAFVHQSANIKPTKNIVVFGAEIKNIEADLQGLRFEMELEGEIHRFETPLLGSFHAQNLAAAIHIAREFGLSINEIQKALKKLQPTEHRLQKIEAGGKLIIDDSFNGNFEGMRDSYELVKKYKGRKVLITPGIIESDDETNIRLANKIDEVFDLVIITGERNRRLLDHEITKAKKIILKEKGELQDLLAQETRSGDLILFSNDAPTFI